MTPGRGRLAIASAVTAIVAVVYGPTLAFPYVQDAVLGVRDNAVVARSSVREILLSPYWAGTGLPNDNLYRPTTIASFALERRLTGRPAPAASHAADAVLLGLTALLLAAWARRLGATPAAAGAAAVLYAGHPVATHFAANVAGRADLLAAALTVVALYASTHAGPWRGTVPTPGTARFAAWTSGAALLLALGAKETAIAAPFLILGQEILYRRPSRAEPAAAWIERLGRLLPSALAIEVWLVLRTLAIEAFPGAQSVLPMNNALVGTAGAERIASTLGVVAMYARRLVWPVGLSADHSGTAIPLVGSILAPAALAGVGVAGAVAVLALAPLAGGRRSARVSIAALALALPYLTFGNVLVPNGAGFAVRLLALPLAGAALLAGEAADVALGLATRVLPRASRVAAGAAAAVVLVPLVAGARAEASHWRNDATLLEATLEATPGSLRAHTALAEIRMREGREDEALALYRRAAAIAPDHGPAWLYAGVVLARMGRDAEAEAAIRRAIACRPDVAEPHVYLGMLLEREGRRSEAARAYRRALAIVPGLERARSRLAALTAGR